MTDDCYSAAMGLKKSIERNMVFADADMALLRAYTDLAAQFLEFVRSHINPRLNPAELEAALHLEERIDASRKTLKKVARKRMETGGDVKAELLYIDLVRNIEKLGDRAFSISESLAELV
jgi:phosphate:Na+ symporter